MKKPTVIVDHSQCTRLKGSPVPGDPPKTLKAWEALRRCSVGELTRMGFVPWDEEEPVLMLIPGEWFKVLPKGLELESISGRKKVVGKDRLDNDIRFGAVAYGIRILSINQEG